jgi:hypothetical protein
MERVSQTRAWLLRVITAILNLEAFIANVPLMLYLIRPNELPVSALLAFLSHLLLTAEDVIAACEKLHYPIIRCPDGDPHIQLPYQVRLDRLIVEGIVTLTELAQLHSLVLFLHGSACHLRPSTSAVLIITDTFASAAAIQRALKLVPFCGRFLNVHFDHRNAPRPPTRE